MYDPTLLAADYAKCTEEYRAGLYKHAEVLRTVVALHPDMTRAEWLAFATAQGVDKGSASNRFYESRRVMAELDASA